MFSVYFIAHRFIAYHSNPDLSGFCYAPHHFITHHFITHERARFYFD